MKDPQHPGHLARSLPFNTTSRRQFLTQWAAFAALAPLLHRAFETGALAETTGAGDADFPDAARVSDEAIARRRAMILRSIAADPSFSPKRKSPKYQHAIAGARLAANPKDKVVLDYLRFAAGVEDDFAYQGLATVFANFGEGFDPDLVEAIRKSVTGWKGFLGGGTENMVAMCRCAGQIFGERFPEEKFFHGLTGQQLAAECRKFMQMYGRAVFGGSMVEYLSPIYVATNSQAWINTAVHARDEEARFLSQAILDWMMVDLAVNTFEVSAVAPVQREKGLLTGTYQHAYAVSNTQWISWIFFGGGNTRDDGGAFPAGREPYKSPPGYHALSSWLPHPVIRNIGARRVALPYSLRQSRAGWTYLEPTMVNAYGKKGIADKVKPGLNTSHNQFRSAYFARRYALGAGYFKADPEEPLMSSLVPFGAWWQSKHDENFLLVVHPFWHVGLTPDDENRPLGDEDRVGVSPFYRAVHHENAAVVLFDIAADDPYLDLAKRGGKKFEAERPAKPLHAAFVHFPDTVDERVESGPCFFLREGDVYIGLRPLAPGADWTTSIHPGFERLHLPGAVTGVALEIGDREEYGSFQQFQERFAKATLDVYQLSAKKSAAYTSTRGHQLRVASVKDTWLPDASVNGAKLDFEQWPICESPYVKCADGVLDVNDGRNGFSIDWHGELPEYTYYDLHNGQRAPTERRLLHDGKITVEKIAPSGA